MLTGHVQLLDKEESTTSSCSAAEEGKPATIFPCFSFQSLIVLLASTSLANKPKSNYQLTS